MSLTLEVFERIFVQLRLLANSFCNLHAFAAAFFVVQKKGSLNPIDIYVVSNFQEENHLLQFCVKKCGTHTYI